MPVKSERVDAISTEAVLPEAPTRVAAGELCLGELLEQGADGRLQVRYRIAGYERTTWAEALAPLPAAMGARPLVLGFLAGDPARPLVMGVLAAPLDAVLAATPATPTAESIPRHVTIEAGESIELVCGEARIKLSACGRTLIEGRSVTSRAATTNRLLGGTVAIN